jgi:type I restriction enzyme S subunit
LISKRSTIYRIGEISVWRSGGTPSKSVKEYWGGSIPWISAKTLKDGRIYDSDIKITKKGLDRGSRIAEKDSILLLVRGSGLFNNIPIGIVDHPVAFNQDIKAIEVDSNIIMPYFLFYWFQTNKTFLSNKLEHTSIGAGKFDINTIKNLEIEVPAKRYQQEIVKILSAIDNKIELNNRINKTLEEMAQAIFKSWFVDFEPFQDGEFEDSELGMIPKGWKVDSLDSVADYLNGLAMQKYRPETEEFLPVVKIKELNQGFTDGNSDKASINIPEQYIVQDGDVIFSWSGTLMVKIWTGGHGGLNQHLFKVTSEKYEKWYFYLWTLKHLDNFKAIAKDKATTMGHIKRSHLTESKVLIPKDADMKILSNIMNPLFKQMIEISVQNKTLKEIRNSLLPKLMSGEIRVPIEEVQ